MKFVVGIPSFDGPEALGLIVRSLFQLEAWIDGLILVADASHYAINKMLKLARTLCVIERFHYLGYVNKEVESM